MSAIAIWHSALIRTKSALAFRHPGRWSRLQLALIGLLILLQLADLATFALTIGTLGLGAEQNPLASAVYSQAGLIGLALIKGLTICVILICFVHFFPRDRLSTVLIVVCVALSSVGAISNVNAYYHSPRLYGAVGHLGNSLKPPGDPGCVSLCLEGSDGR